MKQTDIEEYKKQLKKQCELNGLGMCVGCGITPELLDNNTEV